MVVEVPAGSIVAFSSRLLHATGSNQTPDLRRVYLMQYSACRFSIPASAICGETPFPSCDPASRSPSAETVG